MEETQENITKEQREVMKEYNEIWEKIQENMFDDTQMDDFIRCITEETYASLVYRGVGVFNDELGEDSTLLIAIHRKDLPIVISGNTAITSNCVVQVSEKTGKLQYPLVSIIFEDFYPSNKKIKFIKFCIYHELGHVYEMCKVLRDIPVDMPAEDISNLLDISVRAELLADAFARVGLKLTKEDMEECLRDISDLNKSLSDIMPLHTYITRLTEIRMRLEAATMERKDESNGEE